MLHVFRLFYLNQDTMLTYIKEENFFICLTWLHPTLCGIIVSMLLGENFFSSNTLSIWYSYCAKTPILWEEIMGSLVYKVFGLSQSVILISTFIIQILIVKRQRQLYKQIANGIMVEIYQRDGVTISSRSPDLQSSHKLWMHTRTVVTPQASLFSFSYTLLLALPRIFYFFNMDPSGLSTSGELIIFLTFCNLFFLCNFLETIISPTLRNSLLDIFPCYRRVYHVVTV